jgi:hypothetical protein
MQSGRRTFLLQSLALIATSGQMSAMPHVVLLGDSIFDNAAYTNGKPDVLAQLRQVLPPGWKASLLARDGATTEGIGSQLAQLPRDATHMVLSVGGNNALMRESLLQASAKSMADAIIQLADTVGEFETAYRKAIAACLTHHLPLTICTIYNGNFADARYRRLTRTAVALFDDVILRTAIEHRLKVIELRLVCTRPEDYANEIEPSSAGAARIARAIKAAVAEPVAEGRGAFVLGG